MNVKVPYTIGGVEGKFNYSCFDRDLSLRDFFNEKIGWVFREAIAKGDTGFARVTVSSHEYKFSITLDERVDERIPAAVNELFYSSAESRRPVEIKAEPIFKPRWEVGAVGMRFSHALVAYSSSISSRLGEEVISQRLQERNFWEEKMGQVRRLADACGRKEESAEANLEAFMATTFPHLYTTTKKPVLGRTDTETSSVSTGSAASSPAAGAAE